MWLVHRNVAAFLVFSFYATEKSLVLFFFRRGVVPDNTSQMDILIGTFGTVSILCWNGREVADWCVARRLNQPAA